MTVYRLNPETKKFEEVDEPAAPELLREDLRQLPADMVTKDIADESRVHEFDSPDVVRDLIAQREEQEEKRDLFKDVEKLKPRTYGPLSQFDVDVIRVRVMKTVMDREIQSFEPDLRVRHLWFPRNDLAEYELRDGNPPANSQRPKHLRNLDLEIDLFRWPRRIKSELRKFGIELPDISVEAISEATRIARANAVTWSADSEDAGEPDFGS